MINDIFPISAFQDNYIWAIQDSASNQTCVVDPGAAEPVIEYLQKHQRVLSHILITHHHADHIGGLAALVARYQPCVYGPVSGRIALINRAVAAGQEISVFETNFRVLAVPGHTLDHIAYFALRPGADQDPVLFCGDTLFAAGCGRVFEGDPPMMHASLQQLASLPPGTRVYCAHEYTLANLKFAAAVEPESVAIKDRIAEACQLRASGIPTLPSRLATELLTNPFLRCDQAGPIAAAALRGTYRPATPEEVFAVLRQWKNEF